MQVKCSDGRSEISEPIIKDKLQRKLFRIRGIEGTVQRQLHMGVMQLKL